MKEVHEHVLEARLRAWGARLAGQISVAGAWESAAIAWAENKADLAKSLAHESGRLAFVAEARWCVARVKLVYSECMRDHKDDHDYSHMWAAHRMLTLQSAWMHLVEWVAGNAEESAVVWSNPDKLVSLYFPEENALFGWKAEFESIDFIENLTAWLYAVQARDSSWLSSTKSQQLIGTMVNDSDRSRATWSSIAWAESGNAWQRIVEARALGNVEMVPILTSEAISWSNAAVSPSVEKMWYPLSSASKARQSGCTDAVLAWEKASQAWSEGEDNLAQAWQEAAVVLEEACQGESPSPPPEIQ